MLTGMSVPPLRIVDLLQSYDKSGPVLTGVNLEVAAGESIALVGMNGAGKTTLIKAVLNFIPTDSGTIKIHGISQTDYRARSHLAFLPEDFRPPYYLKGAEFLEMMVTLYGAGKTRTDIEDYSHSLGLDPQALNKPVRQYSKGMAQKLGLIACLLSDRDMLILDEPMNGLDPKSRYQFKRLLQEKKEAGMTLFFSTHLLADVNELCDRMAILHEGRIGYCGSPQECRQRFGTGDLESAYMRCIGYQGI